MAAFLAISSGNLQLEGGLIRLLDFVIISKDADGTVTAIEIEDQTEEYGFGGIELAAAGIAGEEDIAELAELVEPGASAAVVAFELLYARRLAETVAASGAVVLSAERIPAAIVNAVLETAEGE
ncbi:hypothetical protein NS234_18705 [Microbacterium oxydans]|nr:hypothetical protein NS234_18705 [Microbacterium oxydans]